MKYREVKNSYTDDDLCGELEDRIAGGYSDYISDSISEIADNNKDFYIDDIFNSAKDLYCDGYYKRVNDEFGLSGDLADDLQMAEYLRNLDILYDNFESIVQNVAYRKFEEAGIELDYELCADIDCNLDGVNFDRIDNITDKIDELVQDKLKEIEKEKNKKEEKSI